MFGKSCHNYSHLLHSYANLITLPSTALVIDFAVQSALQDKGLFLLAILTNMLKLLQVENFSNWMAALLTAAPEFVLHPNREIKRENLPAISLYSLGHDEKKQVQQVMDRLIQSLQQLPPK